MNDTEIVLVEILMVSGILSLSFVAAKLIQRGTNENISIVAKKVEVIEEIRRMEFIRDLLGFFSNSESSKTALSILDTIMKDSGSIPSVDIPNEARKEIEGLYSSMKLSSTSSLELAKLKYASSLIVKLIVLYGIGLASSIIVFSLFSGLFNTLGMLRLAGTVLIAWALIFSLIVLYLSLDVFLLSKRTISKELSRLGYSPNGN